MRLLDACCLWATAVVCQENQVEMRFDCLHLWIFHFPIDAMKCPAVIGKKTLYLVYFSSLSG
jgi:hypothetical protein